MGYLAGSRALLSQYLQAHPASRTEGVAVEQEREELKAALVTAQESAAIQILLEVCVKTPQDQVCGNKLFPPALQWILDYNQLKGCLDG